MTQRDALLQQALALDAADRVFLVDALERSLPTSAFESEKIAAAWSEEIDCRIAAYDRGDTSAISLEESLQEAKQALLAHQEKRAKS